MPQLRKFGPALQITTILPNAGDVGGVGFINNAFSYNPQTQGAIGTIDASVDKNVITNIPTDPTKTFNNTFRPLIEQNGVFYLVGILGPTNHGANTGYQTISQTDLLATDF